MRYRADFNVSELNGVRLYDVAVHYFSYPVGRSGEEDGFAVIVDDDILSRCCIGNTSAECIFLHYLTVVVVNSYVLPSIT